MPCSRKFYTNIVFNNQLRVPVVEFRKYFTKLIISITLS